VVEASTASGNVARVGNARLQHKTMREASVSMGKIYAQDIFYMVYLSSEPLFIFTPFSLLSLRSGGASRRVSCGKQDEAST